MECVICGKSFSTKVEEKLEHIANIEAKKPNIDKEIDRFFSSDPQKALKLINKIKKYDEEITHLENTFDATDTTERYCGDCHVKLIRLLTEQYNEFSIYHKFIEILEDFEKYSLKAKEKICNLFGIDSIPPSELSCILTNYLYVYDNKNDLFDFKNIEKTALFSLGYYDGSLVSRLQEILNRIEEICYIENEKIIYTEEELEDRIMKIKEMQKSQQEIIHEKIQKEIQKMIQNIIQKINEEFG